MADIQPSSSIPSVRPTEILDPYPERSTRLGGVRQTAPLTAVPDLVERQVQPAEAHTPFAASLPSAVLPARRLRLPFAAVVLSVLGQSVLGASIASGTVGPLFGATASVGLLMCCLMLIVAETISIARAER
ncbi:MAG: hypothetical protein ACRBK7_02215 [Acidimicrobiales bacterium]